jgi:PhnB protein
MTQINAYLNFNGKCREAMTFYKESLGGELTLQTIGDSPAADKFPGEANENILHSTLTNGSLIIMGADMAGASLVNGNNIWLALNCSSEEEINTFFSKLSAGGVVRDRLSVQFWGAVFGTLTDKYGFNWMLNYDKNQ